MDRMPATEQASGQEELWGGAPRQETAFRLKACGDRFRERSLALWAVQLSECGNLLPGPEPREPWCQGDGASPQCHASDRAPSPGLPFSSCSTATGSPGGGGSSTRLSRASTRPGRLGGQTPMWSPGWYWNPSWPPVSRRTRIVARLGVRRGPVTGSGRQNVGGGGCRGLGKEGLGQVSGGSLPHVDLLLCRFSTERTVAWNIFLLCMWVRPGGRG